MLSFSFPPLSFNCLWKSAVLTLVFLDFHRRICTIDFFLNLYQLSIFAQGNIQRYHFYLVVKFSPFFCIKLFLKSCFLIGRQLQWHHILWTIVELCSVNTLVRQIFLSPLKDLCSSSSVFHLFYCFLGHLAYSDIICCITFFYISFYEVCRATIFLSWWSFPSPFLTGPWQVMLKQTDGSFACVAESATRFTLGEVIVLHLIYA